MNSIYPFVQRAFPVLQDLPTPRADRAVVRRLGPYELLEEIGRGQSATVFRARDREGRVVAVKVLAPEVAQMPRRLIRFYNQARHALQISHPNVVQVYEVGEAQGQHFMAMEYISGQTLATALNQNGRFSERSALEVIISVARGLAAIHKHGILHRDVGPRNIFLGHNGAIKLGDLEFSKMLEAELELTTLGSGLGTPDFMSPEQFRRASEVDQRADIYGLGTTLYVMVTGRLPFSGRDYLEKWAAKIRNNYVPPQQINPSLSNDTATIIRQAMMANVSRRPQTAKNFKALAKICLSRLQSADQSISRCSAAEQPNTQWRVATLTPNGKVMRMLLTTRQVTQLVRQRQLGPDARAAREDNQSYRRLQDIEVFRDLFRARPRNLASAFGQHLFDLARRAVMQFGEVLQSWGECIASASSRSQSAPPE